MSKIELKFRQQKHDDMLEMVGRLTNQELIDRYGHICRLIGSAEHRMELEIMNQLLLDSGYYGRELHNRLKEAGNRRRYAPNKLAASTNLQEDKENG